MEHFAANSDDKNHFYFTHGLVAALCILCLNVSIADWFNDLANLFESRFLFDIWLYLYHGNGLVVPSYWIGGRNFLSSFKSLKLRIISLPANW